MSNFCIYIYIYIYKNFVLDKWPVYGDAEQQSKVQGGQIEWNNNKVK